MFIFFFSRFIWCVCVCGNSVGMVYQKSKMLQWQSQRDQEHQAHNKHSISVTLSFFLIQCVSVCVCVTLLFFDTVPQFAQLNIIRSIGWTEQKHKIAWKQWCIPSPFDSCVHCVDFTIVNDDPHYRDRHRHKTLTGFRLSCKRNHSHFFFSLSLSFVLSAEEHCNKSTDAFTFICSAQQM